jgi:hypothetical protein
MNKEKKPEHQWRWRDGEISIKSFYQLSIEDKEEYIFFLEGLVPEELSTQDEYLLRFYSRKKKKKNNFIEL